MNTNTVMFTQPMKATNPRCCSDAKTMCPKCALSALSARQSPVVNHADDIEVLEEPKMRWNRDEPEEPSLTVNLTDADGLEVLTEPVMNWSRGTTRNSNAGKPAMPVNDRCDPDGLEII